MEVDCERKIMNVRRQIKKRDMERKTKKRKKKRKQRSAVDYERDSWNSAEVLELRSIELYLGIVEGGMGWARWREKCSSRDLWGCGVTSLQNCWVTFSIVCECVHVSECVTYTSIHYIKVFIKCCKTVLPTSYRRHFYRRLLMKKKHSERAFLFS